MSADTLETVQDAEEAIHQKPMMTPASILMMNAGFFGIQFSFGITQTAMSPLFSAMGPARTTCRS